MKKFGFDEESRLLVSTGAKEDDAQDGQGVLMGYKEATEFRAIVATLNFLGRDCPDLQYVVKENSREMAKPTVGAWRRLKKVVRYLVGRKTAVWKYCWQEEGASSYTVSDSEWGGNVRDRKSTPGARWLIGGHGIKAW